MNKITDVTGVILAGGKSSRYGSNKALVKVNGTPLIEKVTEVIHSVFQKVVLITNTPGTYAYLQLPMYEDLIKGLGPLGGIYTGLTVITTEAGFFVACDMPSLNSDLIRYMVGCRKDFDAVIPRIAGKMESLHALYAKPCLPAAKRLIDSGNRQVIRFFPEVSVRYVEEKEIRAFDPHFSSFFNINRPEEKRAFEGTAGN
ncbi:MAG: molybdenum cofactor guanylyltransferase [Thermoplasmata archaeon]|nr:MAG: molybdenum cofactor guanylyltransferase [Thermoplasmata archaeon]